MIVHKLGTVRLGKLKGAEYNPNEMGEAEFESLVTSLVTFGFVEPIVARDRDKLMAGGHHRVAAVKVALAREGMSAKKIAAFEVPAMLLGDVSDLSMKALNLALNKIKGRWNYEKLSAVFADWPEDDASMLAATGFRDAEVKDIEALMSSDNPFAGVLGGGSEADAEQHRLAVKFTSREELDEVTTALRERGMTGPKNAGAALLTLIRGGAKQ